MKAEGKPLPRYLNIFFWLLVVGICSWILVWGDYSFYKTWRQKVQLQELNESVSKLKAVNDSLRQENERLKTSPEAAEKAAREQFGLTKEGEKVFRFVPAPPTNKGEEDK